MRSHYCGLVTEALQGQTVTLCGWVNRRRDHGGVIFVDLRDREGQCQVVCDPDRPEMFKLAEELRNEFCIQIKGLVRLRPDHKLAISRDMDVATRMRFARDTLGALVKIAAEGRA